MKFSKAKGKVLPMGQGNPKHRSRLGEEGMESSPKEKDLGVLVDGKLTMSQQCAPVCWAASRAVWAAGRGGDSPPLLRSHQTPPAVLCPALGAPTSEGHGPA